MKNIIRYCGLLLVGLVSCVEDEAPSVELKVALDKQVYQVGEPVTFKLNGNPDNIVFYSGEVGHNYAYKERYHADGDLLVNFNSWVRYGDIYHNLKFLVSSDFSGVYDKENVEAATWIDLSDKFRFSVGDDQTPSGEVNLKEYVGAGEDAKLFVAFRYEDEEKAQQNNWIIRSITLDCVSAEGVRSNLATMPTMGWKVVDFENTAVTWNTSSTSQIQINGGNNQPKNVDWIISQAFDARKTTPDTGVALKNVSTTMDEYKYVYTKPGIYEVVFETTSDWYNGSDHGLTRLTVEVRGTVEEEIPASLSVLPDKVECKVGEPVTFSLTGNNANNVVFYSGESGHNFDFRERFYADNDMVVNFSTFVRNGVDQLLKFKVSMDFDGVYEKEHVEAATWIDLSERFIFSTGSDNTLSGETSLKEIAGNDPNAKLYMAFHHKDERETAKRADWIVRKFELALISPENFRGANQIGFSKDVWFGVDCLNPKKNWDITSARAYLAGGGTTATANDDWVISKPVYIRKGTPDKGVSLNSVTSRDYVHTYNTPGIYKAVFDWYDGSNYSQVKLNIEVKE
jgi:plastocyanin